MPTLTLPNPPVFPKWTLFVENPGTGTVTINPNGLELDGSTSTLSLTQNEGVAIFTDGNNYWTFRGMGGSGGFSNPMTTEGDIIYENATPAPARLGIGTTGQVLTVASGIPAWETPAFVNPMTTSQDLIVGGSSGAPARLGVGTSGEVLTVSGAGAVEWAAATGGGGSAPISTVVLTGQTASISSTNLVASPVSTDLYQILFYLETTSAGTAGTCTVNFSWNDGSSRSFASTTIDLSTVSGNGAFVSGSLLVSCTSGAITYSTTVTGASGSPQYALTIFAYDNSATGGFSNPMTTEGDIIYENATPAPARLAIGSTGQVLTVSGGVPTWASPSGGASNVFTSNVNYTEDESTSAFATKGNVATALQAITVYSMIANVYGNSGDVYQAAILTMSSGTAISGILATSGTHTFASTVTGPIIFKFSSPPTLTAGDIYFFCIQITSGTGTTACQIDTTATSTQYWLCPGLTPTVDFGRIASVAPSSGTVLTGAGVYLIAVIGSF